MGLLSFTRPSSWYRSALLLVTMVFIAPAVADPLPASCAAVFEKRAIGMIVPNRAGGGFDTYGRAIAKGLGEVIGSRVPVSNMVGGGGLIAMSEVADQTEDEILLYVDGVEQVVNTTDATDLLPFGSDAFDILGIFYTEPEAWLAPIGTDLGDPEVSELVFSTSSLESNFVPMVMAAEALGFSIEVVAGYGGSGESMAAVMRGETDLTTASLTSTLRGAASGELEVVMVVSDSPSSRVPNVRPMVGPGSIFEARATLWTEAEREKRQSIAETVLTLGTTRRAIFTASSIDPEALACLRAATDAVMVSDTFVEGLEKQGRSVDPDLSSDAQDIYGQVRAAFEERADEVARMLEEFGAD